MEREYYSWRTRIEYRRAGWFAQAKALDNIYFYQENGTFYEFFTGSILGTAQKNGMYDYVFSDNYGYAIPLSGYSAYRYARKLSAAEFAEQVKPHLEYRDEVSKAIYSLFADWRKKYDGVRKEEEAKRRAADAKARTDKSNEQWLEDMLNNRK